MIIGIATFMLLVAADRAPTVEVVPLEVVSTTGGRCRRAWFRTEKSPLAVVLGCGDLGATLSLIAPRSARSWQDSAWARDVTSFAWSADGRSLFVATSGMFGSGGLYRIDLRRRVAERVHLTDGAATGGAEAVAGQEGVRISGIDRRSGTLEVKVARASAGTITTRRVPLVDATVLAAAK